MSCIINKLLGHGTRHLNEQKSESENGPAILTCPYKHQNLNHTNNSIVLGKIKEKAQNWKNNEEK